VATATILEGAVGECRQPQTDIGNHERR
jgi:hypothetical protein